MHAISSILFIGWKLGTQCNIGYSRLLEPRDSNDRGFLYESLFFVDSDRMILLL